jgi:hypothetical protein
MRAVGRFAYLAALAMLVGGGVLYTFVLTPAIFSSYPRDTAGAVVGTMMPRYFSFQLASLAVATLALLASWRAWAPSRRGLSLGLLLAVLALQLFVQLRLYPRILAVKGRVASFESAPDSPERARFRALHRVSMTLNLASLAGGAVLLALVPLGDGASTQKKNRFPK